MLTPGAVCHTPTSSSGCGYGKGFRRTPSRTPNMAVLAPMAIARVATVTDVNRGALPSRRTTCFNWWEIAMLSETLVARRGLHKDAARPTQDRFRASPCSRPGRPGRKDHGVLGEKQPAMIQARGAHAAPDGTPKAERACRNA